MIAVVRVVVVAGITKVVVVSGWFPAHKFVLEGLLPVGAVIN